MLSNRLLGSIGRIAVQGDEIPGVHLSTSQLLKSKNRMTCILSYFMLMLVFSPFLHSTVFQCFEVGPSSLDGCVPDRYSGGHVFDTLVRYYCLVEIDLEILSTVIFFLLLIQERAVTSEKMCTEY